MVDAKCSPKIEQHKQFFSLVVQTHLLAAGWQQRSHAAGSPIAGKLLEPTGATGNG